jgi:hypothetical protein
MVEGVGAMTDEQRDPWDAINVRVAQQQRAGWRELWRRDDPPRVRMRVKMPDGRPLGMVGQHKDFAGTWVCIDVLINEDGQAVPVAVDCDSE